ncbi:MAG: hypothetical protein O3A80_00070 [bacterium]|nr:hypothetical protein [bacterium]MDA1292492.1 hypothetical protein [bacterium]
MITYPHQPKDSRMRQVRKKLRGIARDLAILRYYLKDRVPHDQQKEFKYQLQRAFDAGRAFSEVQNIPSVPPVDEEGMIKIGPELRDHILEMRQIYYEVDQLREIVANIFDKHSQSMLKNLLYEQEEKRTGTEFAEIEV